MMLTFVTDAVDGDVGPMQHRSTAIELVDSLSAAGLQLEMVAPCGARVQTRRIDIHTWTNPRQIAAASVTNCPRCFAPFFFW